MIPLPIACISAALLAALAAPLSGQDQSAAAARSLEVFPLGPLVAPPLPLPQVPHGTLLRRLDSLELLEGPNVQFDAEPAVALLELLYPEAIESGALHARAGGGHLQVVAPQPLLEQVRTDLLAVMAQLTRPLEIELAVVALQSEELPPTVLAADRAAPWFAAQKAVLQQRAVTRSSRPTSFDCLRWTRYVSDVDVEVAQKSDISQSIVDAFAAGMRARVQAHALTASEDIVLMVQFALGERIAAERMVTNLADQPAIDQPLLASAFGAAAARVPSGGAMVVVLDGDDRSGLRTALVLRPRWVAPRAGDSPRLSVLPVSALLSTALLERPLPLPTRPFLGDESAADTLQVTVSYGEHHMDSEALQQLFETVLGEDANGTTIAIAGGFAFVTGSPALRARLVAATSGLQDRLLRNVELRARVDLAAAADGSPLAAPLDGPRRRWHDVALPCLTGRVSTLFRGLERNTVRCLLVEIAQEASALAPVADLQQAGVWLSARPALMQGAIAADALLQVVTLGEPIVRSLPRGALQLNEADVASLAVVTPLQPGRITDLGAGPTATVDGRPHRSLLSLQAALR